MTADDLVRELKAAHVLAEAELNVMVADQRREIAESNALTAAVSLALRLHEGAQESLFLLAAIAMTRLAEGATA